MKQRLRKLQGHVSLLLGGFVGLRLNYGLLKPTLGDLRDGVPHPPPGVHYPGVPALRTVLFRSCVLDLVKLAWDTDDRTPSVAGLMKVACPRKADPGRMRVQRPKRERGLEDEEATHTGADSTEAA